jgi:GNAT superfamily N-acetyltransferase
MRVRRAEHDELPAVVHLRRQAAAWLAGRGIDQWVTDFPDTQTMLAGFQRAIDAGTTWLAVEDDNVLGCITIDERTSEGLWSPDEVATALFVHRLTLDRGAAGHGLGAVLLDFAGQLAEQAGKAWVRLDAWTTNSDLHRYYEKQGFQLVRIVESHHTPSAACFERPASVRTGPSAPHAETE